MFSGKINQRLLPAHPEVHSSDSLENNNSPVAFSIQPNTVTNHDLRLASSGVSSLASAALTLIDTKNEITAEIKTLAQSIECAKTADDASALVKQFHQNYLSNPHIGLSDKPAYLQTIFLATRSHQLASKLLIKLALTESLSFRDSLSIIIYHHLSSTTAKAFDAIVPGAELFLLAKAKLYDEKRTKILSNELDDIYQEIASSRYIEAVGDDDQKSIHALEQLSGIDLMNPSMDRALLSRAVEHLAYDAPEEVLQTFNSLAGKYIGNGISAEFNEGLLERLDAAVERMQAPLIEVESEIRSNTLNLIGQLQVQSSTELV